MVKKIKVIYLSFSLFEWLCKGISTVKRPVPFCLLSSFGINYHRKRILLVINRIYQRIIFFIKCVFSIFNTLTYQWIAIEILTARSLPVTFTLNVYKQRRLQSRKRLQPDFLLETLYTLALIGSLTQRYRSAEYNR